MPFSIVIAIATAGTVVKVVASLRGISARELLKTDTLWPLWITLPPFILLGIPLGLIAMNVLARLTPLGRVFDRECAQTGRHGFAKATKGLMWLALVGLLVTAVGCGIYVWLAPL